MSRIKIGQIGIGNDHAISKLQSWSQLSEYFNFVGLVVEDEPAFAERLDSRLVKSVKQMTEEKLLNTPGLQAVAVECNIEDSTAIALRCAERGLHMHYEKPASETLEPFKSVVETCQSKNLAIQLGYMYRVNPAIKFCDEVFRKGWLGDIFEIHAVMSRDLGGESYRRYLSKFKAGTMFIFGCHLIDIIISLLGRPNQVTPFLKATRGDGIIDNGLAVLEYPRATATIRTSNVEIDGIKHRRLIICGTKGTVELCPLEDTNNNYCDPLHVRLTLQEDNPEYTAGTHTINAGVMNGRYADQLIELARVINGEIENPYPPEHELLLHEVHLAACGIV